MSDSDFVPQGKKCPTCGSHKLRQFSATAFDSATPAVVNITECKSCGFAWQYPLARSTEESIQYFEAAYSDAGKTQSGYFDPDNKRQIAELELQFVEGLVPSKGTILDIGAGAGIFAEVAALRGWKATALDPALELGDRERKGQVQLIKGTADDLPDGATFNVVTMWDVIEHVTDPAEALRAATRHVANGGWLVLETGNYDSVDRVEGGLNAWMYQIDHRWYFSPESLGSLLRKVGYADMHFAKRAHRPNWNGSPQYSGPSPGRLMKDLVRSPLHVRRHVMKHRKLLEARFWTMPGIPIFTVAARKT